MEVSFYSCEVSLGGADKAYLFAFNRNGSEARQPVDCIFERTRHAAVVFGAGNDDGVCFRYFFCQAGDSGRYPLAGFEIPVVDRHGELIELTKLGLNVWECAYNLMSNADELFIK